MSESAEINMPYNQGSLGVPRRRGSRSCELQQSDPCEGIVQEVDLYSEHYLHRTPGLGDRFRIAQLSEKSFQIIKIPIIEFKEKADITWVRLQELWMIDDQGEMLGSFS